jgi:hypothetical protein
MPPTGTTEGLMAEGRTNADAGVDVGACVSGRSLDLLSSADAYCPDGRIRAPELLDRWRGFFEDAMSGSPSFSCIRVLSSDAR